MPAGALSYQSNGDIIFYRAREVTASVSPHARVCALVGARTIRFSGMAGSVVHLLEQPRPGCDRVLPHSPEPGRGAGRADRNLSTHERVHREGDAKAEGPESLRLFGRLPPCVPSRLRLAGVRKPLTNLAVPPPSRERPESACAVTRRRFPVGARPTRRFAPAGSNRSSHGGNEMAEAFE